MAAKKRKATPAQLAALARGRAARSRKAHHKAPKHHKPKHHKPKRHACRHAEAVRVIHGHHPRWCRDCGAVWDGSRWHKPKK